MLSTSTSTREETDELYRSSPRFLLWFFASSFRFARFCYALLHHRRTDLPAFDPLPLPLPLPSLPDSPPPPPPFSSSSIPIRSASSSLDSSLLCDPLSPLFFLYLVASSCIPVLAPRRSRLSHLVPFRPCCIGIGIVSSRRIVILGPDHIKSNQT